MCPNHDYDDKLVQYWEYYIQQRNPIPPHVDGIRPEILASWRRSLSYSISPFETKPSTLKPEQLQEMLRLYSSLLSVAHPYMENLYSFVKGTNFAIVLTNREACVIDLISDDILINQIREDRGLQVGAIRSEKNVGTAAINLCLLLGQPAMVCGAEHYLKPHHIFRCCAAPIRDKDSAIVGTLSMIGPKDVPGNHVLGMVGAAADGISKALSMMVQLERIEYMNTQLSIALESLPNGVIMTDADGVITQFNRRAAKILQLQNINLIGKKVSELIRFDLSNQELYPDLENIEYSDIQAVNLYGNRIDIFLSAKPVFSDSGKRLGTSFSIDKPHNIRKLATRLGGFTARYTFDDIIGCSPKMLQAKQIAMLAAESDSNLLILGESGTGKELFAQAVHNAGKRAQGPFVAINCASLPKALIESEFFGYERGAFTGASKEGSPGKFELADSGTIFLDEIGDMPIELQASLLRVLQTREVVRIGGKYPQKINVRVIAATNVDLFRSVRNKHFRQDLYFRLNVLTLNLYPLRECREDIFALVHYFMERYNLAIGKQSRLSADALDIFMRYDWPGNIRELENVVERLVNLTQKDIIETQDLPAEIVSVVTQMAEVQAKSNEHILTLTLDEPLFAKSSVSEYKRIISTLAQTHGDISTTAVLLNIPKRTLYRKIKKYNIDLQQYRVW